MNPQGGRGRIAALLVTVVLAGCVEWARVPSPGSLDGGTGSLGAVRQLAAGTEFTCALLDDRRVACWGANDQGQIGQVGAGPWASPVRVPGLEGVLQIGAGIFGACAVMSDRSVRCWGLVEINPGRPALRTIGEATDAEAVGVGAFHACAVTHDGSVLCWGSNLWGTLGLAAWDGAPQWSTTAVRAAISGVTQISTGTEHNCALIRDGTVSCWGSNDSCELGVTTPMCDRQQGGHGIHPCRWTPAPVPGLAGVVEIAAGRHHTCARLRDGTVRCWGAGVSLGNGSAMNSCTPQVVTGLAGVQRLAVASADCAVRADGTTACWGAGDWWHPGVSLATRCGSEPCGLTPIAVTGVDGVAEIAVGEVHACARRQSGSVLCWGGNYRGALGDGTTGSHEVAGPTLVAAFR